MNTIDFYGLLSGVARGNTASPVLQVPTIRSFRRRTDPTVGIPTPHVDNLPNNPKLYLKKELWDGTSAFVGTSITVTLTGNSYASIIDDINAADADLNAYDNDGYLILSLNQLGSKHRLSVLSGSGSAASALGFYEAPHPRATSTAGDVESAPSSREASPHRSTAIGRDEALTSRAVNRALLGARRGIEAALGSLFREVAGYQRVSASVPDDGGGYGQVASVTSAVGSTRIQMLSPTSGSSILPSSAVFSDTSSQVVYDNNGDAVTVTGAVYGHAGAPNLGAAFAAWGTPDNKRIDHSAAASRTKVSSVSIQSIDGPAVVANGAQFLTKGVQAGDPVLILGATNTLPFDHNGEFAVLSVVDEDTLILRPLSVFEPTRFSIPAPLELNAERPAGTVYGSISIYVGSSMPLWMKEANQSALGNANEKIYFCLSSAVPAGNYYLQLPVATSFGVTGLYQQLVSTPRLDDPQVAKLNRSNLFTKLNRFPNIELGVSPASALTARQTQTVDGVASRTLLAEVKHAGSSGDSFEYDLNASKARMFTINAKWMGTEYLKQEANAAALGIMSSDQGVTIYWKDASQNNGGAGTGWTDSTWTRVVSTGSGSGTTYLVKAKLGDILQAVATSPSVPRLESTTATVAGNPAMTSFLDLIGNASGASGIHVYHKNGLIHLVSNAYLKSNGAWHCDDVNTGAVRLTLDVSTGGITLASVSGSPVDFAEANWVALSAQYFQATPNGVSVTPTLTPGIYGQFAFESQPYSSASVLGGIRAQAGDGPGSPTIGGIGLSAQGGLGNVGVWAKGGTGGTGIVALGGGSTPTDPYFQTGIYGEGASAGIGGPGGWFKGAVRGAGAIVRGGANSTGGTNDGLQAYGGTDGDAIYAEQAGTGYGIHVRGKGSSAAVLIDGDASFSGYGLWIYGAYTKAASCLVGGDRSGATPPGAGLESQGGFGYGDTVGAAGIIASGGNGTTGGAGVIASGGSTNGPGIIATGSGVAPGVKAVSAGLLAPALAGTGYDGRQRFLLDEFGLPSGRVTQISLAPRITESRTTSGRFSLEPLWHMLANKVGTVDPTSSVGAGKISASTGGFTSSGNDRATIYSDAVWASTSYDPDEEVIVTEFEVAISNTSDDAYYRVGLFTGTATSFAASDERVNLYYRSTENSGRFQVEFQRAHDTPGGLSKYNAGALKTFNTAPGPTVASGKWYRVRLIQIGTSVSTGVSGGAGPRTQVYIGEYNGTSAMVLAADVASVFQMNSGLVFAAESKLNSGLLATNGIYVRETRMVISRYLSAVL